MPYAILRFSKMRSGPAKALEAHHERKKEQYQSNPDVDTARSRSNIHLIAPQNSYYYEIQSRIEQAGCKVRKDSIKFIDTIVTTSPEFFKDRPTEDALRYFRRAVDFLSQEVGRENIFSAVIHLDEKTPHMHLCFVPLTKDKRLSAKEIIGNRVKLVEWQDKFHDHMAEVFPELERGEPALETGRKHIPVRLYKQATALTTQMEQIQNLMDGLSAFNLSKKKDSLLETLSQWIPKAVSFKKQLNQVEKGNIELKNALEELRKNKQALESRLQMESKGLGEMMSSYQSLVSDYNDIVGFINSIPDNIKERLIQNYEELQSIAQDNDFNMEL